MGTGKDIIIREVTEVMKQVIDYKGKLTFNATKPDGLPRKLIGISRLKNMGWKCSISLKVGLKKYLINDIQI